MKTKDAFSFPLDGVTSAQSAWAMRTPPPAEYFCVLPLELLGAGTKPPPPLQFSNGTEIHRQSPRNGRRQWPGLQARSLVKAGDTEFTWQWGDGAHLVHTSPARYQGKASPCREILTGGHSHCDARGLPEVPWDCYSSC